jgi:hypothetical protein
MLRAKALRAGAEGEDLEMELLEDVEFNMVRGFHTSGRNIRVRVQIKPGLTSHCRFLRDGCEPAATEER